MARDFFSQSQSVAIAVADSFEKCLIYKIHIFGLQSRVKRKEKNTLNDNKFAVIRGACFKSDEGKLTSSLKFLPERDLNCTLTSTRAVLCSNS